MSILTSTCEATVLTRDAAPPAAHCLQLQSGWNLLHWHDAGIKLGFMPRSPLVVLLQAYSENSGWFHYLHLLFGNTRRQSRPWQQQQKRMLQNSLCFSDQVQKHVHKYKSNRFGPAWCPLRNINTFLKLLKQLHDQGPSQEDELSHPRIARLSKAFIVGERCYSPIHGLVGVLKTSFYINVFIKFCSSRKLYGWTSDQGFEHQGLSRVNIHHAGH